MIMRKLSLVDGPVQQVIPSLPTRSDSYITEKLNAVNRFLRTLQLQQVLHFVQTKIRTVRMYEKRFLVSVKCQGADPFLLPGKPSSTNGLLLMATRNDWHGIDFLGLFQVCEIYSPRSDPYTAGKQENGRRDGGAVAESFGETSGKRLFTYDFLFLW